MSIGTKSSNAINKIKDLSHMDLDTQQKITELQILMEDLTDKDRKAVQMIIQEMFLPPELKTFFKEE